MIHPFRRLVPVLAAVVLAASVPAAAPAQSETFTLPVVLSLTGTAAFIGQEETVSLHIIEDAVNKSGGIHGRKLAFNIQDDQSSPQVGVQLVNALIAQHAPVILGPTFTAVCLAVTPLIADKGPVSYCYSPGIHPVSGSYVFSSTTSSHDAGIALAHYLKGRGWTKLAFMSSIDSSGQDFEKGFDQTLSAPEFSALHIVAREHFSTTDLSVIAQLSRIKASNPQVFVTWTTGTGFGTLLHGIHDVGLNMPITASNGNMIPKQLAQYKGFMPDELYFPGLRATSEQGTAPGPVRDKQKVYFAGIAAHHGDVSFSSQSGWDATWLVLDAYRKLGLNPTSTDVRDFIRGQRGWVGIEGVYDFRDPEQRGLNYLSNVIDRFDPATGKFIAVSKPGGVPR
jgi:branched-chain amino acid transport system substrate-binding protein